MSALVLPKYVLEYTIKTTDAVLSQAALQGHEVEIDVYDRSDVAKRHVAVGQRLSGEGDMFRVTVVTDSGSHSDEWNYTILRDSAGRSRKMKK